MNKTVSINIGGLFFHIDDTAFNKLNNYLDAIKNSLSEDSKEEVMNDIEARIGEILGSRIQPDKQVINNLDIDYIISVMGQPEDYIIEDEYNQKHNSNYSNYGNYNSQNFGFGKRLFRDEDQGQIGGVCAGLGHYFGIDTIWIRIIFVLTIILGYGIGLILYIGLWLMVPKAITTSEKLQMRGEPINISNIEKKVKEGYEKVTQSFNEMGGEDLKKNLINNSGKAVNAVESFFKTFLKIIAKFIGIVLFLTSLLGLGGLIIFSVILMLSSFNLFNLDTFTGVPFISTELFFFGLLILISGGIPLLFLFFLSLKILNPTLKYLGRYSILSLISLFIISIFGWMVFGLNSAFKEQHTGKHYIKETLPVSKNDTLFVKMHNNAHYSADLAPNFSGKDVKDENGKRFIYSNNIDLEFKETDGEPYVQIEKRSKSSSLDTAIEIASKIQFLYKIEDNVLNLDNYFLIDKSLKNNKQRLYVYIFVPKNTVISLNKISRSYTEGYLENNTNDVNPYYRITENDVLKCINCVTTTPQTTTINFQNTDSIISIKSKHELEIDSILNARK